MDFGAIPLWTLENPSFHALDAAEIHPYETAAGASSSGRSGTAREEPD